MEDVPGMSDRPEVHRSPSIPLFLYPDVQWAFPRLSEIAHVVSHSVIYQLGRSSAYTGNGAMRMDKVEKQTCISCHMAKEPASADELGAHESLLRDIDKTSGGRTVWRTFEAASAEAAVA